MKKSRILSAIIGLTLAASGLFALGGVKSSKKAQGIEAASTISIFCTKSFDYLIDDIRVHQWGGSTAGTTWGWDTFTKMTKVFDNSSNQPVFKLDIPSDRTGLIFVSKQGNDLKQTVDISSGITNNAGWYFSGWSGTKMTVGTWTAHPYTINYYGNGSTSGSMTSDSAYADVSWGLKANAFAKTGYIFTGWNTNANGSGTSYADSALIPKDSSFTNNTLNLYAQWRASYPSGRYLIGKFGSCDWDIANAHQMTENNSQYEATISLNYGDKLKAAWYNDANGVLNNYKGYSDVSTTCGAFNYFSNDADDNLVCYARGTYNFYVTETGWDSKYISIEVSGALTSEHLAAKLMSFGANPSSGDCGNNDRFPAMKTMFLGLSSTEKTTFQSYVSSEVDQFKNAYDRYVAWAAALGQKPWEEGTVSSQRILIGVDENSMSSIIVIVIVSVLSTTAIGGYFMIKKRKPL